MWLQVVPHESTANKVHEETWLQRQGVNIFTSKNVDVSFLP